MFDFNSIQFTITYFKKSCLVSCLNAFAINSTIFHNSTKYNDNTSGTVTLCYNTCFPSSIENKKKMGALTFA